MGGQVGGQNHPHRKNPIDARKISKTTPPTSRLFNARNKFIRPSPLRYDRLATAALCAALMDDAQGSTIAMRLATRGEDGYATITTTVLRTERQKDMVILLADCHRMWVAAGKLYALDQRIGFRVDDTELRAVRHTARRGVILLELRIVGNHVGGTETRNDLDHRTIGLHHDEYRRQTAVLAAGVAT